MSQTRAQRSSPASEVVEEAIVVEDADESNAVTQELNRNYVGTLSFYREQVEAEWSSSGVHNRPVNPKGIQKLKERFAQNLDRTNPKHHMAATTSEENVRNLLSAFKRSGGWNDVGDDFEALKNHLQSLNDSAEYPLVSRALWDDSDCDGMTLQAGQHRFAALEKVVEDADKQWWPVRIYVTPLNETALTRLRENVTEVQLAQSDGERFVQIMLYRRSESECKEKMMELDKSSGEYLRLAETAEQARKAVTMKSKEFGAGSAARAQATLKRPKFAEALETALSIPAMAHEFSFASMGDILSLRCQEASTLVFEANLSF